MDLPQHVLRFWETRFSQIKPMKRGGGRRYYRSDDVDLLKGIRHLLYDEGYTIKGVQRILKEQGIKAVQAVWRESSGDDGPSTIPLQPVPSQAVSPPKSAQPAAPEDAAPDVVEPVNPSGDGEPQANMPPVEIASIEGLFAEMALVEPTDHPVQSEVARREQEQTVRPDVSDISDAELPSVTSPVSATSTVGPTVAKAEVRAPSPSSTAPQSAPIQAPKVPMPEVQASSAPVSNGQGAREPVLSRVSRPVQASHPSQHADEGNGAHAELSRDDVRRLQSTLFELLECKRILDQVR